MFINKGIKTRRSNPLVTLDRTIFVLFLVALLFLVISAGVTPALIAAIGQLF